MSRWPRIIGCLLGVSLAVAACSSKGPEYPEDHARYKRIDQAVQSLREAYSKKDLSAVTGLLLPGDTNDRVEQDIRKDFQSFEEITVDFAVDRIVIEGETIDVFLHWQGHWKRNRDEMGIRERGHGVLRWVGVQSILLQGVEGDLPFGMGARQDLGGERRQS
jgi:hypothetical protein